MPPPLVSSSLEVQLVALTAQVTELLQEIRILRQENEALRRQVSRGVQQHQPYALPTISTPALSSSPTHPASRTRVSGDLSPPGQLAKEPGTVDDITMPSPPHVVSPKRLRRSLAPELEAASSVADGTPGP